MNNNRYILLCFGFIIVSVCLLVGYGIYINTASNAHVRKLMAAQYARVGVVKASYREIIPVIHIPSINLTPIWMQDVNTQLNGTLTALHVRTGDKVKTGQLIGEINNDELSAQILQAEGNIRGIQARYVRWYNTVDRYTLLTEAGAISRQQLEEAIANRDAAAAEIASAEAQRNQLIIRRKNQEIFSPSDGYVLKAYHAVGAYLNNGQSLIMLGDFYVLEGILTMPSGEIEELLRISDKSKLEFADERFVDRNYAIGSNVTENALSLEFDIVPVKIEPPLSVRSQYRQVSWRVDNKTMMLEPGVYYNVKIHSVNTHRALVIPKKALLEKQEAAVFVVSGDRLEVRNVRTGVKDNDFIEILGGLDEEDAVVISDTADLIEGMLVRAL